MTAAQGLGHSAGPWPPLRRIGRGRPLLASGWPPSPSQPPSGSGPGVPPPGAGPYGQPPQGGTDTTAVLALVLAIVSYLVCPVISAIVALVLASQASRKIQESGGRLEGKGLVTAARVLSWLNLALALVGGVLAVVFLVIAVNTDTSGDTETLGGPTAALRYDELRSSGPGTCLNDIQEPEIVPCDEPHDAELFAVVRLDGTTFPGNDGVTREGGRLCLPEFEPYVGGPVGTSDLAVINVGPNEGSWRAGEREVACLLVSARSGEKLTGSQRGAGA
jgi:hypothetical protein